MGARQRLAQMIRRIPRLFAIAYYLYRLIQPKYSVGVVGVVMNEAEEVLLVEHVFHPRLPWGLPGGWIGHNESPEQTVVREIAEELQLTVKIEQLLIARRTQWNHLDFAFLCSTDDFVGEVSYELLDYDWFGASNLPELSVFHQEAIQVAYKQLKERSL